MLIDFNSLWIVSSINYINIMKWEAIVMDVLFSTDWGGIVSSQCQMVLDVIL